MRHSERTRRMCSGTTYSAYSGLTGAGRTLTPQECCIKYGAMVFASSVVSLTRSLSVRRGTRPRNTHTSPNCSDKSTTHTCALRSAARTAATLTASVVLPTPPLGLNTAMTCPCGLPMLCAAWPFTRRAVSRSQAFWIHSTSSSAPKGLTR